MEDPEVMAAIKTGDPDECLKLIDDDNNRADRCLRKMAKEEKDASMCNRITEKNTEEYCFREVAGATGDESICEQVIDKDSCYTEAASFDNDIDVCKKITEESAQSRCIRYIAAELGEKEHCDQFTGEEYYNCIDVFASKHGASYCDDDKMTDEQVMECIDFRGKTIADCTPLADMAQYQREYQSCLKRGAINDGKATVCMDLAEPSEQEHCVIRVAQEHNEPNACERLTGESLDKCYYQYATIEGEFYVCSLINDQAKKEKCKGLES
jgi:hypothetical protein